MTPPEPAPAPAVAVVPTGTVRYWTAGASAAVAALLALTAFAGPWGLVAGTLVATAITAWGWPALLDLPSPRGTTAVVALGGSSCAVALGLTESEPRLEWLSLALAGSLIAEFVHQLARRDGRPRLVESVSGSVAGVAVLASLSPVIALVSSPAGAAGVVVWAAAGAAALLTQALALPSRVVGAVGAVLGTLVGGVLGGLFADGTLAASLVLGALSSGVVLVLHRLLALLPASGRAPGWLALAVAPLASTGTVGYVVLRLMLG